MAHWKPVIRRWSHLDNLLSECENSNIEVFRIDRHNAFSEMTDTGVKPRCGWYWWYCSPGCLPDGEPHGPFSSATAACEDALGDEA